MEITELLRFAKAYASLGRAVQDQLDDILSGDSESVNPNAFKLMQKKLGGYSEELDEILADFLEEVER